MTFYDQDGPRPDRDGPVGGGPEGGHDPDVWSVPAAAAETGAGRRGPRRPGGGGAPGPSGGGGPRPPRRRPRVEDDEYFDLPHESRVPRWLAALLVVGLLIATIGGGGWWWYQHQVDPSGAQGEAVTVTIPEGSSTSRVADIMANNGVITSATVFNFYVGGKDLRSVQAGTYVFRKNSSFDQAIAVLNAGPKAPIATQVTKVTIPEGYTVAQIVARISQKVPRITKADLDAALASGKVPSSLKPAGTSSYEGLLFPATYEVGAKDDAVDVLTMMTSEMDQRVDALGVSDARAHIKQRWGLDLSPYQILEVASMIQYEAATADDAPKIGAVTYNRMQKDMPLQYDSTSIYEATLAGRDITKIDYKVDTPYNTRTHTGLPPTPIAAPGEYALEGAFQPADGPWLYFVLTDTKQVTFAVTYDDFLKAKQECIDKGLGCG